MMNSSPKILGLLFLLLIAPVLAVPDLEAFQSTLILHQWESARTQMANAGVPLSGLMRVDFHQSRGDFDLGWRELNSLSPTQFSGEEKAYFYLLRGRSEYQLRRYDLCRRNLDELVSRELTPLLELRASILRLELGIRLPALQDQTQELLVGLPETSLTPLLRAKVLGLLNYDRWAESLLYYEQYERHAAELENPRLVGFARILQARSLMAHRPDRATELLLKALEALPSDGRDIHPELMQMEQVLMTRDASPKILELRGAILERAGPSRVRWLLAGSFEELPERFDRGRLLLDSYQEAAGVEDHLAAGWLCLSVLHTAAAKLSTQVRRPYLDIGLGHLSKLGAVYPGYSPFQDAKKEVLESEKRVRFPEEARVGEGEQSLLSRREDIHNLWFSSKYDKIDGLLDAYLDQLEEEATGTDIKDVSELIFLLGVRSNSRWWDPDLVGYGFLKESLPFQEWVMTKVEARPELLKKLLACYDPDDYPTHRMTFARLLFHLRRYQECRMMCGRIVQDAQAEKDQSLARRAAFLSLRCVALSGELRPESDILNLYQDLLNSWELTATFRDVRLMTPFTEALILTGRFEEARELLDRLLEAAGSSSEQQQELATRSVFLQRAMVARLMGEPTEVSLDYLRRGRHLCEASGTLGAKTHERYAACLLLEDGKLEVAGALDTMGRAEERGTSRLPIGRRVALLKGEDQRLVQQEQLARLERYQEGIPQQVLCTRAVRRIAKEIEADEIPTVVDVFLASLVANPESSPTSSRQTRAATLPEFLSYLGEVVRSTEGDSSLLLPLESDEIRLIQESLGPDDVLLHPILLPDRLVRLEVHRDRLFISEFLLHGPTLRETFQDWTALCRDPGSKPGSIERRTRELSGLLWDSSLNQKTTVWLLLPRPLDGLPWALLAPPTQTLRWTDGRRQRTSRPDLPRVLLAGGHPELPGSRREIERLSGLYPQAGLWDRESGLAGLREAARKAEIVHLSGHGRGLKGGGDAEAEVDLGPLVISSGDLYSMRFENHPLVVLATCEGGAGITDGTGRRYSLVTPLRAAGAGAVVASTWALEDRFASDLFFEFHQKLKSVEAWKALEDCRNERRREGLHPYYWSGLFLLESLPGK